MQFYLHPKVIKYLIEIYTSLKRKEKISIELLIDQPCIRIKKAGKIEHTIWFDQLIHGNSIPDKNTIEGTPGISSNWVKDEQDSPDVNEFYNRLANEKGITRIGSQFQWAEHRRSVVNSTSPAKRDLQVARARRQDHLMWEVALDSNEVSTRAGFFLLVVQDQATGSKVKYYCIERTTTMFGKVYMAVDEHTLTPLVLFSERTCEVVYRFEYLSEATKIRLEREAEERASRTSK